MATLSSLSLACMAVSSTGGTRTCVPRAPWPPSGHSGAPRRGMASASRTKSRAGDSSGFGNEIRITKS
jgi:hypothetical protein